MRLSQYLPPYVNLILAILGIIYAVIILVSGIKNEKKSFFYGIASLIKNPVINIIFGICLMIIFGLAIYKYVLQLFSQ